MQQSGQVGMQQFRESIESIQPRGEAGSLPGGRKAMHNASRRGSTMLALHCLIKALCVKAKMDAHRRGSTVCYLTHSQQVGFQQQVPSAGLATTRCRPHCMQWQTFHMLHM